MKTAAELMSKIDQIALHNGNGYNNDILKEIEQFESKIRKDQDNKWVKEIDSIQRKGSCPECGDFRLDLLRRTIINTRAI